MINGNAMIELEILNAVFFLVNSWCMWAAYTAFTARKLLHLILAGKRERSCELSLVSVTESIFVFLSHSSTQAVKHRLHLWSEVLMISLYSVMGISRPIIPFFLLCDRCESYNSGK